MVSADKQRTLKCMRNGCGIEYLPQNNDESSCTYHPGVAEFHEGRKGWTCCSKRVDDFNDFLNISGCTTGSHSDVKPVSKPKSAGDVDAAAAQVKSISIEPRGADPAEVKVPAPKSNLTSTVAEATAETIVDEEQMTDPKDAVVPLGTCCKRKGCKAVYGQASADDECIYHFGEPIFHEGSKGWTCCGRRVLEFDEFLKLRGCQTLSKHRFLEHKPQSDKTAKIPNKQVRHDWYQTQKEVILSLFVKKSDQKRTKVVFDYWSVACEIFLLGTDECDSVPDYVFQIPFSQPIEPKSSSFKVFGTKIELLLSKANGISWASLEPPKDGEVLKSWTTFGTTGFVGSVGAKEAVLSKDSPLYAEKY